MKVEVNEIAKKEDVKYPCLKWRESSGLIVLFTAINRGFAIKPNIYWAIGEYYDGWKEEDFKPFHGTITLSNE